MTAASSAMVQQGHLMALPQDSRVGISNPVLGMMQGSDYTLLSKDGLTLDSGLFGSTYHTLTGFHGAHVLGGIVMLSIVLYRGMTGQFSARHHDAVEATPLYWHFVDVVWILLFTTLYILPGH